MKPSAVAILAGAFLIVGCAGTRKCGLTGGEQRWFNPAALGDAGQGNQSIADELSLGPRLKGKALNILVLSGGGQNGAYGAGLLKGWSDCSVRPRPVFDVVTGISTGALISTFVFLLTLA